MRRRGLTLVEAVIILVALSLLVSILLPPGLGKNPSIKGRWICQSNLHQIALACTQYALDYDRHLPLISSGTQGWADWLALRSKSPSLFECPVTKPGTGAFFNDYFFNARVAGLTRSQLAFPAKTIVFGDGPDNARRDSHLSQLPASWQKTPGAPSSRHLRRANYLFIDGHIGSASFVQVNSRDTKNGTATFAVR